jgi:tetratricopeptide (TPR) repeat protein
MNSVNFDRAAKKLIIFNEKWVQRYFLIPLKEPSNRTLILEEWDNIHAAMLSMEEKVKKNVIAYEDEVHDLIRCIRCMAGHQGFRSEFRSRVEWGIRALALAERLDDSEHIAELCASTIAWPLLQLGEYAEARKHCSRGYAVARFRKLPRLAGLAARSLSGIARDLFIDDPEGHPDYAAEALRWAKEAYECGRESGDYDLKTSAIFDLANAAMLQGNWRRAEKGYRVVVAVAERRKDMERYGARLGDLAHSLMCQGRIKEAQSLYEKAGKIAASIDSKVMTAENTFNLAAVERELGNINEAERLTMEARKAFATLGIRRPSRIEQFLSLAKKL